MSNQALDLLIDIGLLKGSGTLVDIQTLPSEEISTRISQYLNSRKLTAYNEIETFNVNDRLSALFSTSSTKVTKNNLLSSTLIYDSIIIDDPLMFLTSKSSSEELLGGLALFAWAFKLIRSDFIRILPITFFNNPSNEVPLLSSDDAFKSSIPSEIHDFIHENAILKSVVRDNRGRMLVLSEDAVLSRRTALNVSFKDDYWHKGVSLYLFQTLEVIGEQENDNLTYSTNWNPKGILGEEKFKFWAYQSINQAMRARLINIYNESCLAIKVGHTYVTESKFESRFLAMSGLKNDISYPESAKFLEANNSFIVIDSPETVIELRTKFSNAVERFNYTLQNVIDELSGLEDSEFDKKAKILFSNEILPQIDELRDDVNSISSGIVKGTLAGLLGLSAAIITGSVVPLIPALMISAVGGLTEALPSISQYQRSKKKPAYIWHRITKT
ncbi:MAG: hypothetical protein ACRC1Z_17565 [Waterburya sp.]